eukprot:scaffold294958_cov30-Tisochrysis_lutea.AAC.1
MCPGHQQFRRVYTPWCDWEDVRAQCEKHNLAMEPSAHVLVEIDAQAIAMEGDPQYTVGALHFTPRHTGL